MLGTTLLNDSIAVALGNGQISQLTPAQLTTKYGSGNIKTPSTNFTLRFEGQIVHFYKGVPMVVTAALAAALTAANAPVA